MTNTTATFRGAKGGSSSFQQTPDNLRSNDTFEGVLGVGIGPMKGPTNGLKSVKVDGTAVENSNGQLNFGDFIVNIGDGDPLKWPQTITLKLGAGATPTSVGLSLTNPNVGNTTPPTPPTGAGPWVVKTLNNTGADYIDLRFIVNALFKQDKSGIYDTTATIEINMKPVAKATWIAPAIGTASGTYSQAGITDGIIKTYIPQSYYNSDGTWKTPASTGYQIKGKTTSPAVYELRIAVPNTGAYLNTAWDVRCRLVERETYDADPNFEKRTLSWESMAAIYAGNMGTHADWQGVAWMQIYGKASDQLTGVPEIQTEWDTKIVSVPPSSIYDPTTRQYTAGTWDGSWVKSFTTDPAWIINDAITDSLSGLSLVAPGSYLNKWDALEASKWFSGLVPDGAGGTHPRYSMNLLVEQPQKAEDLLRYMAGAVGALAWDQGDGQWRLKCDKLDPPVDIFTLDNIEGEFTYSNTDVDTRYNDIIMTFNNAAMDYREDRVRLYDNPSIAKIGRKPTTLVGVGCTNRQEAMRRVQLRLTSCATETKIVNFTTNRRGRNVEHLDTILIADGDLGTQSLRTTGRVIAISADRMTVTLRDTVYLAPTVGYTLSFAAPNPAYVPVSPAAQPASTWAKPTLTGAVNITNANAQRGNITVLTLDQPLPTTVADTLAIAVGSAFSTTTPKMYRVTNVTVNDDGERISISAIELNTNKWNIADNVSASATTFQDLRGAVPSPLAPGNGTILSLAKVPINQGFQTNLVVNYVRPAGAFIDGFQITYKLNGGAKKIAIDKTQQTTFELVNPVAGRYDVEIRTMDRRGGLSVPLSASIVITQDQLSASDIAYLDGTPVQALKPQDANATNGAPAGSPVAGRDASLIVSGLDFNANTMAQEILRGDALQGLIAARTLINGLGVNTVLTNYQITQQGVNDSFTQTLALLGASNVGGTAFQLNANTVMTSDGQVLSQRLATTEGTLGIHSASIDNLNSVVIDPTGATVRSMMLLNSDGNISGTISTATGAVSTFSVIATVFQIVDPNGGAPKTPFLYSGGVIKMTNVEVDTLKVGTGGTVGRPSIATSGTTQTSTSTFADALSVTVTTTGPATIFANTASKLDFPGGTQPWSVQLLINGSQVFFVDGQAYADSVSTMGALYLPAAGTYTIQLQVKGTGFTIKSRTLFAVAYYGS